MGQMGFLDLSNRYTELDAKNDPLAKIDEVVPREDFRGCLDAVWRRSDKARKSRAGRKPWDAVVMFKTIILSLLYNLSDDQVEHQIRDRLSFMRFLGLGLEDRVPDAKTVWLYREQLTQAGVIEALFETFDGHLKDQGYLAMGGQIIDASIVAVPKQRNSRKENARIKAGETPESWQDKPAKRRQKDVEARWTKKHGRSHYGYKNHVNVDRRHKLVRRYQVSDAATHDSKVLDDILDGDNTALGVWADSAYRSAEIETALKEKGLRSRIHRKGRRNKPLSEREKQGNKTRSSVRVRVEHVFGAQSNDMGGTDCQRRSKSTPLAGVKMHHLMRFSPPGQPWAGLSGFWGFPPFLALLETVAVAVHLQDMNVVCEPVQQRPSQALGTEHLGPLIERARRRHRPPHADRPRTRTAGLGAALRPPERSTRALLPDHHRRLPAAARAAGLPGVDPARGRAAAARRPRLPEPTLTRGRTSSPIFARASAGRRDTWCRHSPRPHGCSRRPGWP